MAKIPLHPKRPEKICWGCDKYCPADAMRCGNGSERTPHPVELFGEDWLDWALEAPETVPPASRVNSKESHS
jgi:hypothetical protein